MTLDVAEALLLCGELRREQIPPIAADLLEAGHDTATIRKLAGLCAAELMEAHDLLRQVLKELGRQPPSRDEAAEEVARHLAREALVPGANLRRVAAYGARLAVSFGYHRKLMPFYAADDEYELPDIWPHPEVDRHVVEYARTLVQ